MSDLFAHGRVRISPDMSLFRGEFEAQLAASLAGVKLPAISALPAGGSKGAAAGAAELTAAQGALGAAQTETTATIVRQNVALAEQKAADAAAAKSAAQYAATLQGVKGGVLTTTLSMLGLRNSAIATQGPFLAAAAGVTILVRSLGSFVTFQRTLNVFQATAGATADQMKAVSAAARELGRDVALPGVSAQDAATSMLELSKAGLNVQQSIAGARGVLQLATAAQISVGEASQIAANELNAFGLSGDQAVHVADVLANASVAAQGSIEDFGLAFKQSAAVANQVGLSLEDTASILTVFAKAGLQGSDAGTSLRTALIRLIAPTSAARQILDALGIQIRDAQGNLRPQVFEEFGQAVAKLAPDMRDAATALVFGQDAIRGVAISAQAGADGLAEAQAQINKTGTAADLAKSQTEGLGGSVEQLKNNASEAGLQLGDVASGPAKAFTDGMNLAFEAVFGLEKGIGEVIGVLPKLGGGLKLIGDQIGSLFSPLAFVGLPFKPIIDGVNKIKDAVTTTESERDNALKKGISGRAFFDPTDISNIGNRIAADITGVSDKVQAAGQELGKKTVDGLTKGISDHQRAVDAAKQAVGDAVRQASESVTAAVISAKSNLDSIGSDLSSSISQAFSPDLDPQIKKLQSQLDQMREVAERATLRSNLRDAQRDLQQGKEGLFFVGKPDPRVQQEVDDFLRPLQKKVTDAKTDIKEFNLEDLIGNLTKARQAQKEQTLATLNDIISLYQHGAISIGQLNTRVEGLLNSPSVRAAVKNAGKTLGGSFVTGFAEDIKTLEAQAKALSPFLARAGTDAISSRVQDPAKAVADGNRAVARAQANLRNAIAQGPNSTNGLLKQILAAIKGTPGGGGTSKTGVGGGKGNPGAVNSTGTTTGGGKGGFG